MKIIAFTKYSYEGPSSRYRFYNYVDCFAKEHISMQIDPFFTLAYFVQTNKVLKIFNVIVSYLRRVFQLLVVLFFPKKYDLVLIEYELLPFFPAVFEYLFKKRQIKYVVDYDDAVFHKYDQHKSAFVRWFFAEKIGQVISNAEVVIVCNPYLEQYAKKYNSNVLRLPTVVLLENYKKAIQVHEVKTDAKPFVIGWIGSKSTSVYIVDILQAMEKFASKYDVVFNLVGFNESVLHNGMKERCKIEVIPWSEESEIEEILKFDVGIMPLKSDPWSKGKCGFKLVQYMSCAKPVVASPVGINTALVKEGENGFLAESADEWFEAFEKLYLNMELREKMAETNIQKIETEYNHSMNCKKYVELIRTTVKS
ncbi:glycosyltransferase [Sulfurovum sp.]|uniref:glycosyltransferase n=1 Tax=Sulfurovum sp. TaxID=1969726 RepID=UPI003564B852